MQSKLLHEADGQQTHAVILATGDEVIACLTAFAREAGIAAAGLTAIGAFRRARLAFFDWEAKAYLPIQVDAQVEVAAFTGDIALGSDGVPAVHAHAVLGRRDGSAVAGHLQMGEVRPTLEVIVTVSPRHLQKRLDAEAGIALIRPRA